jgi:hypothetical protein
MSPGRQPACWMTAFFHSGTNQLSASGKLTPSVALKMTPENVLEAMNLCQLAALRGYRYP